jgi:uncharacterized membrane protein
MNKSKSIMLASAVAFAFVAQSASAGDTAPADGGKVKCAGTHSCKGNSDCKGNGNASCKGQNSCGKQGFKLRTKDECTKMKGTEVK